MRWRGEGAGCAIRKRLLTCASRNQHAKHGNHVPSCSSSRQYNVYELNDNTHFRKHRGTMTSAPTPSSIKRAASLQASSPSSRYVRLPSQDATASASGVCLVTSNMVSCTVLSTRTKGFEFQSSICFRFRSLSRSASRTVESGEERTRYSARSTVVAIVLANSVVT